MTHGTCDTCGADRVGVIPDGDGGHHCAKCAMYGPDAEAWLDVLTMDDAARELARLRSALTAATTRADGAELLYRDAADVIDAMRDEVTRLAMERGGIEVDNDALRAEVDRLKTDADDCEESEVENACGECRSCLRGEVERLRKVEEAARELVLIHRENGPWRPSVARLRAALEGGR